MKSLAFATAVLSFATAALCSDTSNVTKPQRSRLILPSTFKPPQVFKNINLVHVVNLEKGYPKESVNVVIENTESTPQDEYFIPFTSREMETIGALEVKDRKDPSGGLFDVEAVEFDPERYCQNQVLLLISS
jgi:oligosaccharyltransferase complex subunit alpha (ribophorin I)